ncbi:Sas10 C-terminal domain-containing protein [Podospora didyma]|uniref:Sas10 C-terminal domain-containing protein n=1 Tax=Podospora didyma TaxID=330526 RepID=A0AAE0NAF6_9PEZI|nr:Sas10 C-terminal domain-containing protein [Podospora didyma]
MQDADFAFDEGEWLVPKAEGAAVGNDDEDVVIEVLNDAVVTEEMGPEERYRLLQARYPEFDYLVDEFRDLKPLLGTLQKEAEGKPAKSLEMVKFWVLGCYVASLASYFAILTSPARDSDSAATILSPAELRDHEIMETLMSCRENWVRVKQLKRTKTAASNGGMLSPLDEGAMDLSDSAVLLTKKSRKAKLSKSDIKASQKKAAEKAKKVKAVKQSLADLDNLLKGTKSKAQAEASDGDSAEEVDEGNDARSDFGEDEVLDAKTAAEKAHRKKSLRFYTSQIVQKASKRAGAGRDAGGDIDIPYRERLRDRQARLNLEAEKRGKQDGQNADLGQESGDDGDDTVAREVRDDGDEYYDMVAQTASRKRTDKAARLEAVAHAKKSDRIVENVEAGPGGKRQISYQIQKNKGLMPHRRKEVRNPRVKKRMMYEDKQKKLRSVKAQYKGGEGRGGYQGELTGIKTGLVKSTKL